MEREHLNRPAQFVSVTLVLHPSPERAQAAFSYDVRASAGLVAKQTPTGMRCGEDFCADSSGALLFFRVGRGLVTVSTVASGPIVEGAPLAEALARGVTYNLRNMAKFLQVTPSLQVL